MTTIERLKARWHRYRQWRHVRPDSDSVVARMYRESLLHTFGWRWYGDKDWYGDKEMSAITLNVVSRMMASGMPFWCALRWARWIVRENKRMRHGEIV